MAKKKKEESEEEDLSDFDDELSDLEDEEIALENVKVYSKDLKRFVKPDLRYSFHYNYRPAKNIFAGKIDSLYFSDPISNFTVANLVYSSYFGGYDFKGTLNGGGVEITVRTQNGNLYLRKAKR